VDNEEIVTTLDTEPSQHFDDVMDVDNDDDAVVEKSRPDINIPEQSQSESFSSSSCDPVIVVEPQHNVTEASVIEIIPSEMIIDNPPSDDRLTDNHSEANTQSDNQSETLSHNPSETLIENPPPPAESLAMENYVKTVPTKIIPSKYLVQRSPEERIPSPTVISNSDVRSSSTNSETLSSDVDLAQQISTTNSSSSTTTTNQHGVELGGGEEEPAAVPWSTVSAQEESRGQEVESSHEQEGLVSENPEKNGADSESTVADPSVTGAITEDSGAEEEVRDEHMESSGDYETEDAGMTDGAQTTVVEEVLPAVPAVRLLVPRHPVCLEEEEMDDGTNDNNVISIPDDGQSSDLGKQHVA
jgi:hypothetical protein